MCLNVTLVIFLSLPGLPAPRLAFSQLVGNVATVLAVIRPGEGLGFRIYQQEALGVVLSKIITLKIT